MRAYLTSLRMFVVGALMLGWLAASYILLVFFSHGPITRLIFATSLGLAAAGVGFNIPHDGGHRSYSRFSLVNKLAASTFDLLGASSYIWHWKHNVFHHTFVNVLGYDTDINLAGLGRLTPHHPRAWMHRWQHLYVWFLYGAMVVKWQLYDDFRLALTSRMGEHRFPRPRGWQWMVFFTGKLVFLSLAFAIPLALHPVWAVAATYAVAAATTGIMLAVVFQLAHCQSSFRDSH